MGKRNVCADPASVTKIHPAVPNASVEANAEVAYTSMAVLVHRAPATARMTVARSAATHHINPSMAIERPLSCPFEGLHQDMS